MNPSTSANDSSRAILDATRYPGAAVEDASDVLPVPLSAPWMPGDFVYRGDGDLCVT
jgi:hypothetical protein